MVRTHLLSRSTYENSSPGRLSDPRIVFPQQMRHRENHACSANATDFFNSLLVEALLDQKFCAVDEFGRFATYERENDPLKVHVGPDGSFAAFDGNDEIIAEGKGA